MSDSNESIENTLLAECMIDEASTTFYQLACFGAVLVLANHHGRRIKQNGSNQTARSNQGSTEMRSTVLENGTALICDAPQALSSKTSESDLSMNTASQGNASQDNAGEELCNNEECKTTSSLVEHQEGNDSGIVSPSRQSTCSVEDCYCSLVNSENDSSGLESFSSIRTKFRLNPRARPYNKPAITVSTTPTARGRFPGEVASTQSYREALLLGVQQPLDVTIEKSPSTSTSAHEEIDHSPTDLVVVEDSPKIEGSTSKCSTTAKRRKRRRRQKKKKKNAKKLEVTNETRLKRLLMQSNAVPAAVAGTLIAANSDDNTTLAGPNPAQEKASSEDAKLSEVSESIEECKDTDDEESSSVVLGSPPTTGKEQASPSKFALSSSLVSGKLELDASCVERDVLETKEDADNDFQVEVCLSCVEPRPLREIQCLEKIVTQGKTVNTVSRDSAPSSAMNDKEWESKEEIEHKEDDDLSSNESERKGIPSKARQDLRDRKEAKDAESECKQGEEKQDTESVKPVSPQSIVSASSSTSKGEVTSAADATPVAAHAVDANSADANAGDANAVDAAPVDVHTVDVNAGDANAGDANASDANAVDAAPVDVHTVDVHTVDVNAGDANAGDVNASDANAVDATPVDVHTGDVNAGDANAGDVNPGDANAVDANAGDAHAVEKEDTHSEQKVAAKELNNVPKKKRRCRKKKKNKSVNTDASESGITILYGDFFRTMEPPASFDNVRLSDEGSWADQVYAHDCKVLKSSTEATGTISNEHAKEQTPDKRGVGDSWRSKVSNCSGRSHTSPKNTRSHGSSNMFAALDTRDQRGGRQSGRSKWNQQSRVKQWNRNIHHSSNTLQSEQDTSGGGWQVVVRGKQNHGKWK